MKVLGLRAVSNSREAKNCSQEVPRPLRQGHQRRTRRPTSSQGTWLCQSRAFELSECSGL